MPDVYKGPSGISPKSTDDEIVAKCYRPTHNLQRSLQGNVLMVFMSLEQCSLQFAAQEVETVCTRTAECYE